MCFRFIFSSFILFLLTFAFGGGFYAGKGLFILMVFSA